MKPYLEKKLKPIYRNVRDTSYDFPYHFHHKLEISYCFFGSQRITVGGQEILMQKGDAVIIFPNTPHEYFSTGEETKSISLVCNVNLLSEIFPDIVNKSPTDHLVPSDKISKTVSGAFESIADTEDSGKLLGYTYIVLSEILQSLPMVSNEGDKELPSKVVAYIDENFKEPLTINYIAKAFGYHPSYIAHVFSDQLKISFRTYLGSVRAEYAAKQIRTTKKNLTEIAFDSGCNSLNTFCRCFKKHFGTTPSQYKKSLGEKNA